MRHTYASVARIQRSRGGMRNASPDALCKCDGSTRQDDRPLRAQRIGPSPIDPGVPPRSKRLIDPSIRLD